jgi:flagellar secretion chaperone FliS
MRHPASTYRQLSVQSSTPLGLVVMLYDGAIAALQQAMTAMEIPDTANKCFHLNRALAIVAQLEGTLNFEQGGEVARTLKSLYVYARGQILKGNVENSTEVLRALAEKLSVVREAWYEADRRPASAAPQPAGESPATEPADGSEPSHRPPPPRPAGRASAYGSFPITPGSLRMTA